MSDRIHRLKTLPEYFNALWEKRKTFEVRHDDRGFDVGDFLQLQEFEPSHETRLTWYTDREMLFEVTYKMHGGRYGLNEHHCVLGIRELGRTEKANIGWPDAAIRTTRAARPTTPPEEAER